jgi:hypothetical protein
VIYPVGSCYFSTVKTSPAAVIGGTWVAMTGGMLGLAGSTGVAEAASDGGSRKIQAAQLPDHTHTFKWKWNTGNATSGSDNWAICLEGTTESAITDYTKLWYAGGGQDYIPAHTSVYGWRRTA